jgi:hypothetical protein
MGLCAGLEVEAVDVVFVEDERRAEADLVVNYFDLA